MLLKNKKSLVIAFTSLIISGTSIIGGAVNAQQYRFPPPESMKQPGPAVNKTTSQTVTLPAGNTMTIRPARTAPAYPSMPYGAPRGPYAGPAPMPGARPYDGPAPMPGARPYAGPGPMPGARPYAGPGSMPGARPYAGPEPMPGARPYAGPGPMPGARPYAGPGPMPGARPYAGPAPRPGARPYAGPAPRPGARPFAGPGPMSGARPVAGPTGPGPAPMPARPPGAPSIEPPFASPNRGPNNGSYGNGPRNTGPRNNGPYGNRSNNSGPFGNNPMDKLGFGPFTGNGNDAPWETWPFGGRDSLWNRREIPFKDQNPADWVNMGDPKEGMAIMWDDLIAAPDDLGEMPGGWYVPSVSVPNPVDLEDQLEEASKEVPDLIRVYH
ncbi:MAG: hypothetical protein QNL62_23110 [Gammaproteobacteria bacterium]|nr:hypothetical protein [Gammaproteobacteria bacterium]